MRRLPEEGMLPRLLARSAVRPSLLRRIARDLVRFHAGAATGPGVDEYGSLAVVRGNWRENFDQVRPFIGRTVAAERGRDISAYVERFLANHQALLERRVSEGRIREGHGDLHAASICVERGRPRFFDCLEFNPRFRCADVAAEVAFLAMDLDHHGRADLAEIFVESYVRTSGDQNLCDLLDFYKCYRAFVRGKVLSLRLAESGVTPEEERRLTAEARAYFDLAWTYAGGLARPILVVTMGRPASGKTSLARALAGRFGLVHLSSDQVRKELAGLEPTQRVAEGFDRGLYAPAARRRTYAVLRRRAAQWLRRGRSVVLDATYGKPTERAAVVRLAHRLRARLVPLVCRADEATLLARLAARAGDPENVSDARPELWPELRSAYREPTELRGVIDLDTGEQVEKVLERAAAALYSPPAGGVDPVARCDPADETSAQLPAVYLR
jgi:predicted kinase